MLAKYLKIFCVYSLCMALVGCNWLFTRPSGLPLARDQAGRLIPDCEGGGGSIDIYGLQSRIEKNNLPKNTVNIVCENGRTVLPKDCEGNRMNRKQIERYWKKYNLPIGLNEFDCRTGTPQ